MGGRRRPRGHELHKTRQFHMPYSPTLPPGYPLGRAAWLDYLDSPFTSPFDYAAHVSHACAPALCAACRARAAVAVPRAQAGAETKTRAGAEPDFWPAKHVRTIAGGVVVPWGWRS